MQLRWLHGSVRLISQSANYNASTNWYSTPKLLLETFIEKSNAPQDSQQLSKTRAKSQKEKDGQLNVSKRPTSLMFHPHFTSELNQNVNDRSVVEMPLIQPHLSYRF
mgnify:CR=1 FL=1